MEKKCSKCGETKDVSEFTKSNRSKDGLRYECKQCRQQYQIDNKEKISESRRIYQKNNKEMLALKKKQHYELNKEIILKRCKQYYENNKERISKWSKRYYDKNKETIIETVRQYASKNKEKISKNKKQYHRANAKYKIFYDRLTMDESPKLHSDGVSLEVKCKYCGNYFVPTNGGVGKRIEALNGETRGDNYLYCSENCKQACPIYGQIKYPKGFKKASSREVDPYLRQMCFERDNWTCQICGKTIEEAPIHCHHMDPATQNPMFQNDIDSVITLCEECHQFVHTLPGCNYYELRC